MERWIKERLWETLVIVGGGLLAFGTLQAQVTEQERKLQKLEDVPVTVGRIEAKLDALKESVTELKNGKS
jgi:hypothetical protein